MRNLLPFLVMLAFAASCDTERNFPLPEESHFVKFYGEEGEQEGVDFIVNTDGTVVMVGNSWMQENRSDQVIYVVKTDANGQQLWSRKIGLLTKRNIAKDIELHADGRIVIAGETEIGPGNKDVYVKILSQDGAPLDSARFGFNNGSIDTDETVNSITIINGGGAFPAGFIVTGSTTFVATSDPKDLRDALHLRFDNALDLIPDSGPPAAAIWGPPRYGYNSDEIAFKVVEIDPDTYYVFGYSNRTILNFNGDYNFWYYALSADGKTKLGESYIGKTSESERLTSLEISPVQSGPGFLLAGTSERSGGRAQSYVVKLSPTLNFNSSDVLREVNPTNLGNPAEINPALSVENSLSVKVKGQTNESFLLLGTDARLVNTDNGIEVELIKLKRDLSLDWPSPLIFGGEDNDLAGAVTELPNGRILVVGTMTLGGLGGQKKMVLMKLNADGKLLE